MKSAVTRVLMAILMLCTSAVAFAAPASAGPEHGSGGTSEACQDGWAPGTGFETGSAGSIAGIYIGGQTGIDPAIGHAHYLDVCASVRGPGGCIPGVGCLTFYQGVYMSSRQHSTNTCNGMPGSQLILKSDPGSLYSFNVNNCPNG